MLWDRATRTTRPTEVNMRVKAPESGAISSCCCRRRVKLTALLGYPFLFVPMMKVITDEQRVRRVSCYYSKRSGIGYSPKLEAQSIPPSQE